MSWPHFLGRLVGASWAVLAVALLAVILLGVASRNDRTD